MVGPAGPGGTVGWAHRAAVTHLLPLGGGVIGPAQKHSSGRLDAPLRGNLIAGQASPPMVAEAVEVILQQESRLT